MMMMMMMIDNNNDNNAVCLANSLTVSESPS